MGGFQSSRMASSGSKGAASSGQRIGMAADHSAQSMGLARVGVFPCLRARGHCRTAGCSATPSSNRSDISRALGRLVGKGDTTRITFDGKVVGAGNETMAVSGDDTALVDRDGVRQVLESREESFVLSAEEVERIMGFGLFESIDELLRELTRNTSHLSLPPISNFRVSCAALGESGRVYVGVNIEFKDLPLPCALHAEQFLILNAFQHGESAISKLCISHVPCGHCRQFMCELSRSEDMQISILGREPEVFTLPELLPLRFTPRDLIGEGARFLFEEGHNGLVWAGDGSSGGAPRDMEMAQRALAEANASYAPYSNCPSGLCIRDQGGKLYSGCLIESAAYNPTVSPLHSALVNGLVGGLPSWQTIDRVTLVETEGATVKHEHLIRECLKFICPDAEYSVLYAKTS